MMKKKLILTSIGVLFLLCTMVSGALSAEKTIVWRFQPVHVPGQLVYDLFAKTVEDINIAAKGRLKIEIFPGGSFASSMEAFQACGQGVFQIHSSWPIYLRGLEYAFQPMSGDNMAMSDTCRMIWLEEGGGNELLQKGFDKFNLHLIATQMWPPDLLMAQKPFQSIAEMKGAKFRTSAPYIAQKKGIAAITLPLEEVFTSMASGAVEMAEFAYLEYNKALGITDVAKYGIYPDWWNGHFVETIVVNKDAWNKLPDDLKKIVELGFKANALKHWTKANYESAKLMRQFKDEGSMEFIRIDRPDEFAEMRRMMYEYDLELIKERGGLTKEAFESLHSFYELWYPLRNKSTWWGEGMNINQQIGYPEKK